MKHKSSLSTLAWLKLPTFVFAVSLAITGCGSSSDSDDSSNSGDGSTPTIGGKSSDNPCMNGEEIDLKCYMVPGVNGEKSVITENVYLSAGSSFDKQGKRTRTFNIKENEANMTSSGARSTDTLRYEWGSDRFKVDYEKEYTMDMPRKVLPNKQESMTLIEDGGGDSFQGYLKMFNLKTHDFKMPTTSDKLQIKNAVLRVSIIPKYDLVNLAFLAPRKGLVASIDYTGCKTIELKNSVEFYETNCGHGNKPPIKDEAFLRIPGAGDSGGDSGDGSGGSDSGSGQEDGGSGETGGSNADKIKDKLEPSSYTLTVTYSGGIYPIKVNNVGLVKDTQEFCDKFKEFSWGLYARAEGSDPSEDECLLDPKDYGVVTSEGKLAQFIWN